MISELSGILITAISSVTGTGGVAGILLWRHNKRMRALEAQLAEANVNKAKIESKADEWDIWKEQLAAEREHVRFKDERITELLRINAEKETRFQESEKDKTIQIRKYVADVLRAEQEVNRVQDLLNDAKDRITELTEERDEERRLKEYYKRWRCEKSVCDDPEGRRPPNSKLSAETYVHPEKE